MSLEKLTGSPLVVEEEEFAKNYSDVLLMSPNVLKCALSGTTHQVWLRENPQKHGSLYLMRPENDNQAQQQKTLEE
ncbi:predicted protein [Arabidopsis lyrata subsp. lyrata]|uniref:Predicted protein n=1 Tax=Arabidopsis lyrata subsp. lyrata TaxID=81972 RepID=D7L147_ARALL|nr:predicted protein [Arabidopsis lyrata subsp. lyrata]